MVRLKILTAILTLVSFSLIKRGLYWAYSTNGRVCDRGLDSLSYYFWISQAKPYSFTFLHKLALICLKNIGRYTYSYDITTYR